MNDTGCQNEQGAPSHVMIECLKRIIREYQNLAPPDGLFPRRVAIGSLPGKVSVVTGVRGSGKTTLLRQRIHQLIESGVPRENILHLDLADDRLYWLRHENPDLIIEAYFEVHPQKRGSETVQCFFDEVQSLPHWQLFIDRILRTEKCEVTVAGSLLPSPGEETACPLGGRIVSWDVLPLSFREFLDGKGIESDGPLSTKQRLTIQKAFEDYCQIGGFPGVNRLDQQQRIAAHQANWNTILANIIGHHNISHPRAVIDLTHWLVDNNGSYYAVSHLTDYLKSLGHRVRKSSVVDWLVAFEDAELPGLAGQNRLGKKDPGMSAVAGAGNLQCRRDAEFPTGLHEGLGILPPVGLIEIGREKIAAVVAQERIDADSLLPSQMVIDHLIGHRQQLSLVAIAAFHPGFMADAGFPLIAAGR